MGAEAVLSSAAAASRAIAEAHFQETSNSQQRSYGLGTPLAMFEHGASSQLLYMRFPGLAKPAGVKGLDLP